MPCKYSLPCVTPSHSCPYQAQTTLCKAKQSSFCKKRHLTKFISLLVWALPRTVDTFNPVSWVTVRTGTQNFYVLSGQSWGRGMSYYLLFLISVGAHLPWARHSEEDLTTTPLDPTPSSWWDTFSSPSSPPWPTQAFPNSRPMLTSSSEATPEFFKQCRHPPHGFF